MQDTLIAKDFYTDTQEKSFKLFSNLISREMTLFTEYFRFRK